MPASSDLDIASRETAHSAAATGWSQGHRASHMRLSQALQLEQRKGPLAHQLDEIVDAVNSLGALLAAGVAAPALLARSA
jgi:hypothetical protein